MRYNELAALAATNARLLDVPVIHPVYYDTVIGRIRGGQFAPRFAESWYARSLARNAIQNYDGIVAARAAGNAEDPYLFKNTSITPAAAASWYSLLRCTGLPTSVSPTAATSGGAVMNRASTGAIPISNPASGNKYLLTVGATVPSVTGFAAILLVDVLWMGGAAALTASPITINGTAINRYLGIGGLLNVQVSTALTTTATNVTATYTNQAGTGSRTSGAIVVPASAALYRIFPQDVCAATPQAGDTGIVSVQSIALSATVASGNLDVCIYKPLALIPTVAANSFVERDSTVQIDGLTQLPAGSDSQVGCLGLFALSGGTSACATEGVFLRTCNG